MGSVESEELRKFWSAPTFEDARYMILPPRDEWEAYTKAVMPLIWTDTVNDTFIFNSMRLLTAVEIGCGVGRLMIPMAKYFNRVIGLDISPQMLEYARIYKAEKAPNLNLDFRLTDGSTFPVESDSVDFVYSVIVLQHIPYRDMLLRYFSETHRILRQGGLARLQTYKGEPSSKFDGYYGHWYRTLEEFVSDVESSGLKVVEATDGTMESNYLWVTVEKI